MNRLQWLGMIVVFAVVLGRADWATAQLPDATQSYYVPQAGLDYGNPLEGDDAIPFFRACPNNDGGASLPEAARIKIVVKNSSGDPIEGVTAADICILFNGGTSAQGFGGVGADSVIANSTWNQTPLCPDVRCVEADGPTDADGATYITFTGPGGVRDPNRKWGHYDTELPVYVLGIQLFGRKISTDVNGTYVLRIKNFDHVGGLGAVLNQGETVTATDFNALVANLWVSNALSYWRDFDSDGEVGLSDYNMLVYHVGHDCDSPNNP